MAWTTRYSYRLIGFLLAWLVASAGLLGGCSSEPVRHSEELRRLEQGLNAAVKKPAVPIAIKATRAKRRPEDSRPVYLMKSTKPVRAIYVSSYVANSERMSELIRLIRQTELNAIVLDVNSGIQLTVPRRTGGDSSAARPVASQKRSAEHFRKIIRELKHERIYLIARIVTFKNPELAQAMPDWAIRRKDGTVWKDRGGFPWIDPYRQESWDYSIALAEYAASLGFDEVQFDYVRFPENGTKVDREVKYANPEGWTKDEAIRRFLHRANHRIHKRGIKVSADVFGMVGSSDGDMGIGQKWSAIAREVDVISPMIYPSHYSDGMWGIPHPDLTPGQIVRHALKDATKRNEALQRKGAATAKVRPWLQGFTATWIHPHQRYGGKQIREQILAARSAGYSSYMLWNSSSRYPEFAVR